MSKNLQGMFWALLATALFGVVAAMAKVAVAETHVLQILFIRQVVVFVSVLPQLVRGFPASLRTSHPLLHGMRLIGAFVALSAGIWAVAVLPLAMATTLGFAQVFFVVLLAGWLLREPVGMHHLSAIAAGFAGVIVVMRPDMDGLSDINVLIPIAGALGASVAVVCVRKLAQSETTATLLVYQSLFVCVLAGLAVFWPGTGVWVTPDWPGLLFLVAMGVLATIGQWVGIKALRLGQASVVGAIEYTKLIHATLLGYLIFAEIPDGHTVAGAVIIVAASAYLLRQAARGAKPGRSSGPPQPRLGG